MQPVTHTVLSAVWDCWKYMLLGWLTVCERVCVVVVVMLWKRVVAAAGTGIESYNVRNYYVITGV